MTSRAASETVPYPTLTIPTPRIASYNVNGLSGEATACMHASSAGTGEKILSTCTPSAQ